MFAEQANDSLAWSWDIIPDSRGEPAPSGFEARSGFEEWSRVDKEKEQIADGYRRGTVRVSGNTSQQMSEWLLQWLVSPVRRSKILSTELLKSHDVPMMCHVEDETKFSRK